MALALTQLFDYEVEQLLANGQRRPGQREDVVAQPLGERTDIARQGLRPHFSFARPAQPPAVVPGAATPARPAHPRLELQALRARPHGQPLQGVGERLALALDMEHIAVAGCLTPGSPLPGAQALARIGNRVLGCEPLLLGIEQAHAPRVTIAVVLGGQQVTVGRIRIDAGQHRAITVEDLVMQAHANAREVLLPVDRPGLLRDSVQHLSTLPTPTVTPSRSRINSTTPRYELRQISGSPTITWRSQVRVTGNWNSTSSSATAEQNASSSASLALSFCA
ncbi:hypothetical protein [Burkholderia sp. AU6039]|uniref:hypothetical protein n=1 Tax=Burkholderia sp. AU6039 TaxID=2015344 RepID=UPI000B7A04F6|nr:hypothetical protein [Burkholderia sp. AU6039]OXJ06570.1 hypothetical protein CFB39_38625 [Burkholderia sp. AU6039]